MSTQSLRFLEDTSARSSSEVQSLPNTCCFLVIVIRPRHFPRTMSVDFVSTLRDKDRGAARRRWGVETPSVSVLYANRNGIVSLTSGRGACGVYNRFSELKAAGIVSARFSNSPITRIKGNACGGAPPATSPRQT